MRTLSTFFSRFIKLALLGVVTASIYACTWTGLASVGSSGQRGDFPSLHPSVSGDGRYVAFDSRSRTFLPDELYWISDVFVKDNVTGIIERVSENSSGMKGHEDSSYPSISADGRYIAFRSFANNLVPEDDDTGSTYGDIFLHDRQTSTTTRLNVDSQGNPGGGNSFGPVISANGRYVVFNSSSSLLVSGDTNLYTDVFVHDLQLATTKRVSVDSAGNEANLSSGVTAISADGRFIVFHSQANNLVLNGTYNNDVFVHDQLTATTSLVSVNSEGESADGWSLLSDISADGRFVTFRSSATNLVEGDTNEKSDIFVHDRQTGATTRVNVSSTGEQSNNSCDRPSISADGRHVAFHCAATNLAPEANFPMTQVFVHDRQTGVTELVSADPTGTPGDGRSWYPDFSADGRYVAFETSASNLFPNDVNGHEDIVVRAFPTVRIVSITPNMLPAGSTTSVAVTGHNFLPGTLPNIKSHDAEINNVVVVDETLITMDVAVDADAVSGAVSVDVGLPGTGAGPLSGSAAVCEDCVTFF